MNSKYFNNGLQVALLVLFLSSSFSYAHLKLQPPPTPQCTPNPQPSMPQPQPTPISQTSMVQNPRPKTPNPTPNIAQTSTSHPTTNPQPSMPQPQPTPISQTSIVQNPRPKTPKPTPNIAQTSTSHPTTNPQPSMPQPQPTPISQTSIVQNPRPKTPKPTPNIAQTSTSDPTTNPQPSTPTSQPTTNPKPSQSDNPSDASINYQGTFKKVYAFGDSYTDTGNAKLLGGLKSFVSDLISKFASLADPNGGEKLPGSRLCNGKLVIDFLCDSLGLPTPPPYKDTSANFSKGVNFAISGSTGLSSDFFAAHKIAHTLMWKAIPETFKTQLDWFTKHLTEVECKGLNDVECKGSLNNSLFWVGEMGGNDYSRTLGSSISIPWLTEMNIGHVFNLVKTLIERGAKYIVVQGLPPAGCSPLQLALSQLHDRDDMGCASLANGLIQAHNKLLQTKLEILRKLFPHCVISYIDYTSAYKNVLSNHKQYNLQEPFKACCGAGGGLFNFDLHHLCGSVGTSTCKQPDQFINWDGVHLTEAMHKVLSDLFFHKQGFCQPSFLELIKHKKGLLKKALLT